MRLDPSAIWFPASASARAARAALLPLSALYGAGVAARNWAYDHRWLPSTAPALPVLGVGNLTVGGTGKTPLTAWLARELARRGTRPAVLLRGYQATDTGSDEAAVHRMLNPDVPVVVDGDRLAGARQALALGFDVAVADDAFQHRRLRCHAYVVLVSADAWRADRYLLPAGPWREPLARIRQASAAVITVKAAGDDAVRSVADALTRVAPNVRIATARLLLDAVCAPDGEPYPLSALRDRPVYAVAGVGDPDAFFAQIRAVTPLVYAARFPDHHDFTPADARAVTADAALRFPQGCRIVCTVKDVVKLGAFLPEAWYLSQRVVWERGADVVLSLLDKTAQARSQSAASFG